MRGRDLWQSAIVLGLVTSLLLVALAAGAGAVEAQATGELAFEDQTETDQTVQVENVSADEGAGLFVAYEDGDDLRIAGMVDSFEPDGSDLTVDLVDRSGVPGPHVALLVPADAMSTPTYSPGDALSADTIDAALTEETASVSGDAPTSSVSDLDIDGQGPDATVVEGEVIELSATVTNDANNERELDVDLTIAGLIVDSTTTDSLAPGESETVTFEGGSGEATSEDDPHQVSISTADAGIGGTLTVEEAAGEAELSDLDIAGGGNFTAIDEQTDHGVSVTVTNVGDGSQSFGITLDIEDEVSAVQSTGTLEPGESETVEFEDVTGDLPVGVYQVMVSSAADVVGGTLEVQTIAESSLSGLDIAGQGANATISEGADEPIRVDVTNTGEASWAFELDLQVGSHEEATTTAELAPGETETVTFDDVTADLEPRQHGVQVAAEHETVTGVIDVTATVAASVTDIDILGSGAVATITEGTDGDISATITNTGVESSTFSAELQVGNDSLATVSTGVLEPEESETVIFEAVTGDIDAGEYPVTVAAGGGSTSGSLVVQSEAAGVLSDLDIAGQGADAVVRPGADEAISVNVTNVGDATETFTVGLLVGPVEMSKTTRAIRSGETETVTFDGAIADVPEGEHNVTVSVGDTTTVGSLDVVPTGGAITGLDIAGQGAYGTIETGTAADIGVEVANQDEQSRSFDVTVSVGKAQSETTTDTIGPGESTTVQVTGLTADLDPAEYEVEATTEADQESGTLVVTSDHRASLSNLNIDNRGDMTSITQGEDVTIAVDIVNEGDIENAVTFPVTLVVGDVEQTVSSQPIRGATTDTLTFEGVTSGLLSGVHEVTVTAPGDEVTGELTVETDIDVEVSDLDIAGQGTSATVGTGEGADISMLVTNVGDSTDSATVELTVGEDISETATTDTLEPGTTETVTFSDVGTDLPGGQYDVTLTASGVTASGSLTLEDAEPIAALSTLDIAGQGEIASIEVGESGTVSIAVENVGDGAGVFEVTLNIDDQEWMETTDTVEPGGQASVEFGGALGDLAPGEYDVTVTAGEASEAGTVTVSDASDDDRDEDTDEPTDDADDGGPGLGVAVALVGVLFATGLLVRRTNTTDR